jgi:hypothetical protein
MRLFCSCVRRSGLLVAAAALRLALGGTAIATESGHATAEEITSCSRARGRS